MLGLLSFFKTFYSFLSLVANTNVRTACYICQA